MFEKPQNVTICLNMGLLNIDKIHKVMLVSSFSLLKIGVT